LVVDVDPNSVLGVVRAQDASAGTGLGVLEHGAVDTKCDDEHHSRLDGEVLVLEVRLVARGGKPSAGLGESLGGESDEHCFGVLLVS
jgi:hypothetical protein